MDAGSRSTQLALSAGQAIAAAEMLPPSWSTYAGALRETGTVMLPLGLLFDRPELHEIIRLQSALPEETVVDGDARDRHNVYVRRVMTDAPGMLPSVARSPGASRIICLITDRKRSQAMATLLGDNQYLVRRCQVNRLAVGSFVGMHIDAESNPTYEYSAILQLGDGFEGGDFVVYPKCGATAQVFKPKYGSMILTTCQTAHEVQPVLLHERKSLVWFYSKNSGRNPRSPC